MIADFADAVNHIVCPWAHVHESGPCLAQILFGVRASQGVWAFRREV